MSDLGSVFKQEPGTQPGSAHAPGQTRVQAPLAAPLDSATRARALAAGAGAALVGGLVWAGVVIATNIDFGILAWLVGAATGFAVVRVAGGAVTPGERIAAGVLAAAGIVVGKYVIFVHAVKKEIGDLLAVQGLSVGYFDTRQMSIFTHNVTHIFRPVYLLWFAFAFAAAFRVAGGSRVVPRRR